MKFNAKASAILVAAQALTSWSNPANAGMSNPWYGYIHQSMEQMSSSSIVLVDQHGYRHCHYVSIRMYCHTQGRLPINWPPNTDTPHRS